MSQTENQSGFMVGYLSWSFIIGILFIPITMAITTTDRVQDLTDWKHGYGMILGAIIGIALTLIAAFIMERLSRP